MIQADAVKLSINIFRIACKKYMFTQAWKTINQYDRMLWSACRNFFTGETDAFGFIDDFSNAIEIQLTKAWNEGAREVGVDPRDMEDADLEELQSIIDSELDHVLDLAEAIEAAINAEITDAEFRGQFRARIDLWVSRYTETVNRAKVFFGDRQKLEWQLGATEEHCETCSQLNGIVAWAKEWEASGIKPQNPPNPLLACGGWKCDCKLNVTDKRRTPRALDRLMDIAASRGI